MASTSLRSTSIALFLLDCRLPTKRRHLTVTADVLWAGHVSAQRYQPWKCNGTVSDRSSASGNARCHRECL